MSWLVDHSSARTLLGVCTQWCANVLNYARSTQVYLVCTITL
jgi:hypothetical protein